MADVIFKKKVVTLQTENFKKRVSKRLLNVIMKCKINSQLLCILNNTKTIIL